MKFRIAVISVISIGFFAACSGGSESAEKDEAVSQQAVEKAEASETEGEPAAEPESQPQTMGAMHGGMMDKCPMHVEGTTLSVEDTETGVAMMFMNEASAAQVQDRAMKMAEHHDTAMQHHGSKLPKYTLQAEKAEKGAKLMLNAEDPATVKDLQTMVKERHQAQGDKKCPMMLMYEQKGMKHKKGMKGEGMMHKKGMKQGGMQQ